MASKSEFQVVHHVFFWLKNKDSEEDKQKLIAGVRKLGEIEQVQNIHVGLPADTEQRGVVDGSFSVTEMLIFANEEDEAIYKAHPKHKEFVANCEKLWEKVLVYDSREVWLGGGKSSFSWREMLNSAKAKLPVCLIQ